MIKLVKNETVYYRGGEFTIFKVKDDLVNVLLRNKKTGAIQEALMAELTDRPLDGEDEYDPFDLPLDSYPKEKLQKAQQRLAIITPFLGDLRGDKAALRRTAEANNLDVSTLYKWIAKIDAYGHVGCLVDSEMKGGKDKGRFDDLVEEKINEIIYEVYLDGQSFGDTYRKIVDAFEELGYKVPHENSIRRRIQKISEYERTASRVGPRTADQKFDAKVGSIPHAKVPLSLVQIDHTQLDIMLVDEAERKPFKRPWITVLIDVFSRVVLGFYISFDPPGAYAVGRAIAHAVLRKEKFLKSIGLEDVTWPCWGKMATLFCDNGKDFRGTMLKESCANYLITLKWRPPRKPEFGGHIERLMGTIAEELKDLAGTTKVSKEMRAKFKPEKTAAMTLSEFERWFTLWVAQVYNKRPHRGIGGQLPIEKWREGINGNSEHPGIGKPQLILDEDKLRLDLLPQYKRTIQRTGVHILKFKYFSGVLRKWIGAVDEKARGKVKPQRQFVFKMNPHDISEILFLDPSDNKYHTIQSTLNIKPYRISIWEYRRAYKEARKSKKKVTQNDILNEYKKLNAFERESKRLTKEAKKKNEREIRLSKEGLPKAAPPVPPTAEEKKFVTPINEIKAYEELEYITPRRSFK